MVRSIARRAFEARRSRRREGVELLIDCEGVAFQQPDQAIDDAVWNLGFVHLRAVNRSLIVTLCPRLVQPVTMAGVFYELADFAPESTYIIADRLARKSEMFQGFRPALRRIYELVAAAGDTDDYPLTAGDRLSQRLSAATSVAR